MIDYPEGFDVAAHRRWVEAGLCSALNVKTYCSGQAQHRGDHWAPKLLESGAVGYEYWPNKVRT